MEKKNVVFLTVLAVATLLTAVVGTTFAYFTATVTNTNTPTATSITTANNLEIEYSDGARITGEKIVPGWASTEKTISVTNNSNVTINYQISWTDVANNFSKGGSNTTDDLVYSLVKVGTSTDTNMIGATGFATAATTGVKPAGYTDIAGKWYSITSGKVTNDGTTELDVAAAPDAGVNTILVPSTSLAAGETDTYKLRVYFVETGIAQTENQSTNASSTGTCSDESYTTEDDCREASKTWTPTTAAKTVTFEATLQAAALNVSAAS